MTINRSRGLRSALLAFSALAGASAFAQGAAAAPASWINVGDDDDITISSDMSGDPVVRYTGAGSVVVEEGATITGTGNYQEFPPDFNYSWTDGRGAVIINAGGGSLTIEEGAAATGANYGVTTAGDNSTVENGQWVFSGYVPDPSVESNFTLINHGEISGEADDGVRLFNRATVINTGTIIGASELAPHTSAAIGDSIGDGISSAIAGAHATYSLEDFPGDGVQLRVDNSGTIEGRRMGIIASTGASVTNSGRIYGQSSGVMLQNGSIFGGSGIVLYPYMRGELFNSGEIVAKFQNGASIWSTASDGAEFSIDVSEIEPDDIQYFAQFDYRDADAVVINSGLIETFADAGAIDFGYVTDPATGEQVQVEGYSQYYAVQMLSPNGYIRNEATGVIRATNGANAIQMYAIDQVAEIGGVIVLDNDGQILGGVVGSDGQEIIRNNGLIDGDVALGLGDDVFFLDADGEVTGTIDLGDGDDLMVWNTLAKVGDIVTGGSGANTLALILGGEEFDATRVFNFDSVLTFGSGNLENIDLSYVPEIQVNEGASLNIGATGFVGTAFINPGGQLVGVGQVQAIVMRGSSTLAPGNSIGTILVTGDVDLSAEVTYDVEVARNGSDQVLADGEVTIGGGTLNVTGEDGVDLLPGQAQDSYVILAGAAGLTGEFAEFNENLRFYDVNVVYTGTEVVLEMTPIGADFNAMANTANQAGVGAVLYNALLGANGDFLDAMRDSFPGLSSDAVRTGLDTLGGPIHAWAPVAVSEIGVQAVRAAAGSAWADAGTNTVWASGLYTSMSADGTNGAVDADLDTLGGAFGFNAGLGEAFNAGVFAGYATGDGGDAVSGSLDSDGWFLGAHARAQPASGFSFGVQLGYLNQTVDTRRDIAVGSLSRTASASYDVSGWFFGADVAWMHPVGETWQAGLFGEVAMGDYEADDFVEVGAGSLSLQGQAANFERASWRAGVRITGDTGWVRPHLEAGLQMEGGERGGRAGMSFTGVPGRFTTTGAAVEAQAPFLSLGADFGVSGGVNATIAYDGVFGDTMESHGAMARVTFAF